LQDIQVQLLKKELRTSAVIPEDSSFRPGRLAELIRRSAPYGQADCLYVAPAPILHQVRVNALVDGKKLIMPGPGLKDGFFCLEPYTIPFADLGYAVSFKGVARFGRLLTDPADRTGLEIGMLITHALLVDEAGGRLGMGTGFFDLSYAIFAHWQMLAWEHSVLAAIEPGQISAISLPMAAWDVYLDYLVTDQEIRACSGNDRPLSTILWQHLSSDRIKKITPLFQLARQS